MQRETASRSSEEARTTRIAWLASFVAPAAVLLALLVIAQPSQSAVLVPPPPPPPGVVEPPEEEPEEDVVEEEEEEFEDEGEEEEFETDPFPPEECLLRTARARLFAYTAKDKVRLVIRYTSLAPAQVTVDYRMKGRKGSLGLGEATQRFKKKGLFRTTESLSEAQMDKVRAAKSFDVTMEIPAAPKYCRQYHSRHLSIKRVVENQVVWFQSDSIFGTDA